MWGNHSRKRKISLMVDELGVEQQLLLLRACCSLPFLLLPSCPTRLPPPPRFLLKLYYSSGEEGGMGEGGSCKAAATHVSGLGQWKANGIAEGERKRHISSFRAFIVVDMFATKRHIMFATGREENNSEKKGGKLNEF